jgi:phosphate/sulfate permease
MPRSSAISGSVGARPHRWIGAALVGASGAAGAIVGWTVATTMVPPASSPYFDWVELLAVLAAMVAGPLIGVFAGLVLLRVLRREATCPRCGTANPKQADACSACELAFMPLEGSRMG